jgi:alanine dehydrogenase
MNKIIGIRREDISKWERRTPLIPAHARDLVRNHPFEIRVQPSETRIFRDDDYRLAGLSVEEGLSPCRIVLAIKEIPLEKLEKDKVYIFFSHTTKGQPANMPMLKRLMELGCTLIDYEKMVDEKGRRVLYFGNYAGHAGMVDTLWALGRRLQEEGIENPFAALGRAHTYANLTDLKESVGELAWRIGKEGLPPGLSPLVFGFLGYGHVSQGAQEVFDILPFEDVSPRDVPRLFQAKADGSHLVFKAVFKEEDMVEPIDPAAAFELQDYYQNPQNYKPVVESLVPYFTVLLNCIFWTPKYPRFVTKAFLKELYGGPEPPRLRVIGDITCDVKGSIESTVRATDIENPVFVYDPLNDRAEPGFKGVGPAVLAVYNLPAELPLESSTYFSGRLKEYVPALARADFEGAFAECGLPDVLKRAVILYRGGLTPDYAYLNDSVASAGRD